MADNEEVQTAVPLDTVATRKLIAKVKKGFSELDDKISERSVFDADFDNDELVITKRA